MLVSCQSKYFFHREQFIGKPKSVEQNRYETINLLRKHDVIYIRQGNKIRMVLAGDKFFEPASAQIKTSAIPIMVRIADYIETYGNPHITVSGHTDNVGSWKSRLRKSKLMATNVAAYFWAQGIPRRSINIRGYSDNRNVSSNRSIVGSSENRRVEITFIIKPI